MNVSSSSSRSIDLDSRVGAFMLLSSKKEIARFCAIDRIFTDHLKFIQSLIDTISSNDLQKPFQCFYEIKNHLKDIVRSNDQKLEEKGYCPISKSSTNQSSQSSQFFSSDFKEASLDQKINSICHKYLAFVDMQIKSLYNNRIFAILNDQNSTNTSHSGVVSSSDSLLSSDDVFFPQPFFYLWEIQSSIRDMMYENHQKITSSVSPQSEHQVVTHSSITKVSHLYLVEKIFKDHLKFIRSVFRYIYSHSILDSHTVLPESSREPIEYLLNNQSLIQDIVSSNDVQLERRGRKPMVKNFADEPQISPFSEDLLSFQHLFSNQEIYFCQVVNDIYIRYLAFVDVQIKSLYDKNTLALFNDQSDAASSSDSLSRNDDLFFPQPFAHLLRIKKDIEYKINVNVKQLTALLGHQSDADEPFLMTSSAHSEPPRKRRKIYPFRSDF